MTEKLNSIPLAEKEPERVEISPGRFFTELREISVACLQNANAYLEKYRYWEKRLHACNLLYQKARSLKENGFRIKYFRDEEGNLTLEAVEKGEAGFIGLAKHE